MKTEFVDVNETRKNLRVEIPSDVVDAEIDRVARDYSRKARIPASGPGKAPARVIKQRFKDQILHDVAHDLIPRAVDEALRERGVEPVDTPDIRDVIVEEGQPLTFTASFDTRAAVRAGRLRDASRCAGRRAAVDDEAVDQALERLRERAARYEPVEGRGVDRRRHGRRSISSARDAERQAGHARRTSPSSSARRRTRRASTSSCSASRPGATKTFTIHYPGRLPDHGAGRHRRHLHGDGQGDQAARAAGARRRVREGSRRVRDARRAARRACARTSSTRRGTTPEREVRARADEAAGRARAVRGAGVAGRARDRSAGRGVRPAADGPADRSARRRASTGRRSARASATRRAKRSASALVLDEVARREAARGRPTTRSTRRSRATPSGRAGRRRPCARALEKEGGLSRVHAGLRREKSIDFVHGACYNRQET